MTDKVEVSQRALEYVAEYAFSTDHFHPDPANRLLWQKIGKGLPLAQAFARFEAEIRAERQTSAGEGERQYTVDGSVYEAAVKGRQDFRNAYREARAILSPEEWAVVEEIAHQQEFSVSAALRQAVRLYQLHMDRIRSGETVTWSGDAERAREFAGPLATPPVEESSQGAGEVWKSRDGCVGEMNAERAAYFLERFKREEKFLGPHEQWALDFIIAALAKES